MSTTLLDAYELFQLDNKARRFSKNTQIHYKQKLSAFFNFCQNKNVTTLEAVTPVIIKSYLVSLQERELKDYTIDGNYKAIQTFLNFCVRDELLSDTPMRKVSAVKVDKKIIPALTQDEIKKLLKNTQFERDNVLILFLLDSLMRASEVLALNIEDVDLKKGTVTIHLGKGGKSRITYIGAKVQRKLIKFIGKRGAKGKEPLFVSERGGKRLSLTGLDQIFRRMQKKTGILVTPHALRRTGFLFLLKQGMSVYHLQKMMGHTDIKTLRHYLALVDEDVKSAHEQYGVVDNLL